MAKIKEEDIDALRESADIVDVVGTYTTLKKSGGQTYKGLCPFHSEKTPSFTVDAAKGLTHCFGCQEGGNVYQFLMKVENLPFPEAVEWLARRSNFELHYEEMRPGEQKAHGLKARVIAANKIAADFFHRALMTSPDALDARRYLEGRGFGREIAERWHLGYAPGRDALTKHLLAKGFTREEMERADLSRKSDRDGSLYDTFRQRIIFPTWNLQGDVVAFGGRAMGDAQPKYLNSAETPVFSKSRVMYGLDRAKSAIARSSALVVEGYTDVIALHEAGVSTAVATNGVALGETHFDLLKKFSDRAILMFDADEAGKGATERGFALGKDQIPLPYRLGLELLVAPLPPGRDPAELVAEKGEEGINKIISDAQPIMEFIIERTLSRFPLDTPESQSAAVRAASTVLGWQPDPIARHKYLVMAADRIGVDLETVQRSLSEQRLPSQEPSGTSRERDRRLPGNVKVEREALRLLLTRPKQTESPSDQLTEEDFTAPARRELFTHAKELREGKTTPAELSEQLSPDAKALFTELTVGVDPVPEDEMGEEIREVFARLTLFRLERQIRRQRNTLQEINPLDDAERHDALFTELVGLEAERRDLLKTLQGAG
jgi:DNA primase